MPKDIVIKVKECDDRKIVFKLTSQVDFTLNMDDLNYGRFTISYEIIPSKDIPLTTRDIEYEKYKKECIDDIMRKSGISENKKLV